MHPWNTEHPTAIITTRRHVLAHTQWGTHMRMYSRALCTARHQSPLLPLWWQPLLSLPSKVRTAAHFPKLTPINTFQKIPQILRSNRRFLSVAIQLVWIIIHSPAHPSWVRGRSHTAQKPISTNETAVNHKYMYFFNRFHFLLQSLQRCCF